MNFSSYIQNKNAELSKEQLDKIQDSESYIRKHKLDKVFNEILAQIIIKRPEDVKELLKKELEAIKANRDKDPFFTKKDFEILFENYDVQRTGYVKFKYLKMAFEAVGIKYDAERYKKNFGKDVNDENSLSKVHFLDVMQTEYRNEVALK